MTSVEQADRKLVDPLWACRSRLEGCSTRHFYLPCPRVTWSATGSGLHWRTGRVLHPQSARHRWRLPAFLGLSLRLDCIRSFHPFVKLDTKEVAKLIQYFYFESLGLLAFVGNGCHAGRRGRHDSRPPDDGRGRAAGAGTCVAYLSGERHAQGVLGPCLRGADTYPIQGLFGTPENFLV